MLNNNSIHDVVKLWLNDELNAIKLYGIIDNWDVSDITNMDNLFYGANNFNNNINKWNVSNVTTM